MRTVADNWVSSLGALCKDHAFLVRTSINLAVFRLCLPKLLVTLPHNRGIFTNKLLGLGYFIDELYSTRHKRRRIILFGHLNCEPDVFHPQIHGKDRIRIVFFGDSAAKFFEEVTDRSGLAGGNSFVEHTRRNP